MASTGRELTWKEDNLRVTSKLSKKAKLARQYYSTLAREQKPPLAREQKPPLAREQKPPLAREQKPPLALVVNKDNQSRTVSPFLLATAGADKHQPRYSLTSLKRKRAPARAPPAIEKERPLLSPHREPTCKALGRWQSFAERSQNPANNTKSSFPRESTQRTPLNIKRDFSPSQETPCKRQE